jgi:hypothetical protein
MPDIVATAGVARRLPRIEVAIMSTSRLLSRPLALALALLPTLSFAQSATTMKSATWWNPAESGWGLFTVDQGNYLATGWFTYDADGEPTWFLMPGVTVQSDGSYRGEVHRFTGVPLAQIAGQAADPSTMIGTGTLRFESDKAMQFSYTVNGQTQNKSLTRFAYGDKDLVCKSSAPARAAASNYSDLWYNAASSGWGLFLQHVDSNLYGSWYTYDTDREAVFLAMVTTRQADGSFTGELYRQRNGTPFSQIDGARPSAAADVVGSVTLRFTNGENGTFTYTIGGTTQTKSISRIQFGSTAAVCEVQPYQTAGNNGGQGEDCHPPYRIGDTRQLRTTSVSNGQSSTSTFRETVVREATFNGQSGFMQEVEGQTSAGNGVYARNYVGNGSGSTASFGAEALNPGTGQVISTSLNVPARVELPSRFTIGQTVPLDFKVNASAQGFTTTVDIKATYKLVAKENVTVPAGTFSACKFETTIEESSNTAGVSTRTLLAGTSWTSGSFGLLKRQDGGTSTVTGFGQNLTTNLSSTQELLSARMSGQSVP